MKPPAFDLHAPSDLGDVLRVMADYGDKAKVLAGGQSLVPMLNFRLLSPEVLVDLNRVSALGRLPRLDASTSEAADVAGLTAPRPQVELGALVRHVTAERSLVLAEHVPLMPAALKHVGHLAIRNRGTVVGSLCHADPAAEMCAVALLLNATMTLRGLDTEREVDASDFFRGPLETALEPDELVMRVRFESMAGAGWGFHEVARRTGDFAMAGAAVVLMREHSRISEVRVSVFGAADRPVRMHALERAMSGEDVGDKRAWFGALDDAVDCLEPMDDLHASADFRRHLAAVSVERAFDAAVECGGDA